MLLLGLLAVRDEIGRGLATAVGPPFLLLKT